MDIMGYIISSKDAAVKQAEFLLIFLKIYDNKSINQLLVENIIVHKLSNKGGYA